MLIPGGGRKRRRRPASPEGGGSGGPNVLFSDLTAAPKTGWSAAEPNKGAAVSVWHYDHGAATRGSNYITVNGAGLTSSSDYAEWNVASYDVPFLRRTTFWLNSACADGVGEITLTVNGATGTGVAFRVITGRCLFCDVDHSTQGDGSLTNPFNNPTFSVMNDLWPGDILYFRETASPISTRYLGGHSNFFLSGARPGTEEAPIACVAYPGEVPELNAFVAGDRDINWSLSQAWWTVSKFKLQARYHCIDVTTIGSRAVGNDCQGCSHFGSGVGIIFTLASQHHVLGNSCHGGRSANKLDHAIYISGNPSVVRGVEVAYNYVYDNNFVEGPMIVINHQSNRIPQGSSCKQHKIHHNLVDTTTYPSRGIGCFDMSWESGNPNGEEIPETALIYNNILDGCGYVAGGAFYCNNYSVAKFYNNTLVNGHGLGLMFSYPLNAEFVNNIMHMVDGTYLTFNEVEDTVMMADNNIWYGVGAAPGNDANAINSDPLLDSDYRPNAGSPAIDAGDASVNSIVTDDFYGAVRATTDIGAVEA